MGKAHLPAPRSATDQGLRGHHRPGGGLGNLRHAEPRAQQFPAPRQPPRGRAASMRVRLQEVHQGVGIAAVRRGGGGQRLLRWRFRGAPRAGRVPGRDRQVLPAGVGVVRRQEVRQKRRPRGVHECCAIYGVDSGPFEGIMWNLLHRGHWGAVQYRPFHNFRLY